MAVLTDRQFEVNGLVFGTSKKTEVKSVTVGGYELRSDATPRVRQDGRKFGQTFYSGRTLDFELHVRTNNEQNPEAAALSELERVTSAWMADEVRLSRTGAVLSLRYAIQGRTRRVYGRPGRLLYDLALAHNGFIPITAQFETIDQLFYEDDLRRLNFASLPQRYAVFKNFIGNPSFEVDTSLWSATNVNITASGIFSQFGAQSMRITPTGVGSEFVRPANFTAVVAGEEIHASAYAFVSSALTVSFQLVIDFFDGFGVFVSSSSTDDLTTVGTPERLAVTSVVPGGAQQAFVTFQYVGTPAVTDIVYVDGVMLVEGNKQLDYFDGDINGNWTGTPYASTSIRTFGGHGVPASPPVTLADPLPVADTAINTGNSKAWPIFNFYGPGKPRVAYPFIEKELSFSTVLNDGELVVVDTRPHKRAITRNGDNIAGLLRGNRLKDLYLPVGNTLVDYDAGDTTGRARLVMDWEQGRTSF